MLKLTLTYEQADTLSLILTDWAARPSCREGDWHDTAKAVQQAIERAWLDEWDREARESNQGTWAGDLL